MNDFVPKRLHVSFGFRGFHSKGCITGSTIHLLENTFDRKRISANPSPKPKLNS